MSLSENMTVTVKDIRKALEVNVNVLEGLEKITPTVISYADIEFIHREITGEGAPESVHIELKHLIHEALYETNKNVWGKAAQLLSLLSKRHVFDDGNKRTAWIACYLFLTKSGMQLVEDDEEDIASIITGIVTSAATGKNPPEVTARELQTIFTPNWAHLTKDNVFNHVSVS